MNPERTKRIAMIGWALHAAGVAVVLLAGVAFYTLVYCPLRGQMVADADRSAQLQLLLASSAEVQREQRPLREQLDKLLVKVAQVRSRLPQNLDAKEFASQVRLAAQESRLQVLDHQLAASQTGPGFSSTEIRFQLSGSFASICDFLKEVSQFTRVTEISQLNMQSTINSESYPIQVTFVLYYGAKSHDREVREIL
jgi:Tfp pilus assembly protein PilO